MSVSVDIYNSTDTPGHYQFLYGTVHYDVAPAGVDFYRTVVFDNSTINMDIPVEVAMYMEDYWQKNITITLTSEYSINLISFAINITGSMDDLFGGGG